MVFPCEQQSQFKKEKQVNNRYRCQIQIEKKKITSTGDFPGGPMVKNLPSNAMGVGSVPDQGAKIPHTLRPKNQNIK